MSLWYFFLVALRITVYIPNVHNILRSNILLHQVKYRSLITTIVLYPIPLCYSYHIYYIYLHWNIIDNVIIFAFNSYTYFKELKRSKTLYLCRYSSFLLFFSSPKVLFPSGIIFPHPEELPLAFLFEQVCRWWIVLIFLIWECHYFAYIPERYFCGYRFLIWQFFPSCTLFFF